MISDPTQYLVEDHTNEKQFNFSLHRTLNSSVKQGILNGYRIHVTANVLPGPDQMKGKNLIDFNDQCYLFILL